MKNHLLLSLVWILTSAHCLAVEDWRLTAYDQAQGIIAAKNHKLTELLRGAEPKLAEWCARTLTMEAARQKAERYGFISMLRANPDLIVFDKPSNWVRTFEIRSPRADELAKNDPAFDQLFRDYWEKRKATGGSNPPSELYEPIRESIAQRGLEIDLEMRRDFDRLESEVAKGKANQSPQPTPLTRHG